MPCLEVLACNIVGAWKVGREWKAVKGPCNDLEDFACNIIGAWKVRGGQKIVKGPCVDLNFSFLVDNDLNLRYYLFPCGEGTSRKPRQALNFLLSFFLAVVISTICHRNFEDACP